MQYEGVGMTNQDVLEILRKIDNGYKPREGLQIRMKYQFL